MGKGAGEITAWPQGGLTKRNTPELLKAVRANEVRQARIVRIAQQRERKLRALYGAKK